VVKKIRKSVDLRSYVRECSVVFSLTHGVEIILATSSGTSSKQWKGDAGEFLSFRLLQAVSNDGLPATRLMSRYKVNDVVGRQVTSRCYTQSVCTHESYNMQPALLQQTLPIWSSGRVCDR